MGWHDEEVIPPIRPFILATLQQPPGSNATPETDRRGRVLVVGFDGATWDLLYRYANDGTMPNLGMLLEDSLWGDLISTIPPVTAPAWASLSTGKNPGKTGVFAFYTPLDSIARFRPITSLDVQSDTLPELLERGGLKVHVVNLPTFSYPTRISGTVLGDVLCPPGKTVNPPSLLAKESFRRYRNFPNMSLKGSLQRYIRDIRELEEARFRCARELLNSPWDFVFVMFSGVDWIQHELYGDLLDGVNSPGAEEALRFFGDLDRYLGWFVKALAPQDHLLLVSDHGFEKLRGTVSINHWLIQKGYLKLKRGASGLSKLAGRVPAVALPTGTIGFLSRHPRIWELGRRLWRVTAGNTGFSGHLVPDPSLSSAFAQDFTYGIYINSKSHFKEGILNREQEEQVIGDIVAGMRDLAEAGLIESCVPAREVYSGPFVRRACELIIKPTDRGVSFTTNQMIDDTPRNGHSMKGIYLIRGEGVGQGRGREASICDVFPTVLELFGMDVPGDVDGVPIIGALHAGSGSRQVPLSRRVLTEGEEALIRARLDALGYS